MAKASVTSVTLVLSLEEALWLRGFVQNDMVAAVHAVDNYDPGQEDPTNAEMRKVVFDALAEVQW